MFGSWICILWPFVRRVPTSKNVQQSRFQNHQDMQLDGYSPGWKLEVLLICSIGSTIRGWHQWVKGKNADNPRRMLPREYCSNTLPVSNNINRALLSAFWWEGRDEKDSELWIPWPDLTENLLDNLPGVVPVLSELLIYIFCRDRIWNFFLSLVVAVLLLGELGGSVSKMWRILRLDKSHTIYLSTPTTLPEILGARKEMDLGKGSS